MPMNGKSTFQNNIMNANKTTAEPWDDKNAMNKLYNKRNNNYEQILADTNGQ